MAKRSKGGWWTAERQRHAYSVLTEKAKLTDAGARALVSRWANVEARSGPTAKNPKGAFGIAQWTGDRKRALGGATDFDAQLEHVVRELNGKERRAGDLLRSAQTFEEGALGASAYERAEGYNAKTKRDNFTRATLAGMPQVAAPDTQIAQAEPASGLAAFFSDPLGMSAQAAEAPGGLMAYAAPEPIGATGYDPAKNPAKARAEAMFAATPKAVPTQEVGPRSLMMGSALLGPQDDARHNFPGMSVPADTASPRTMATLGGISAALASMAPDASRFSPTDVGMPTQSLQSFVGAPPSGQRVASFAPGSQLNSETYTPSQGLGALLSPDMIGAPQGTPATNALALHPENFNKLQPPAAPALSPPTEVADNTIGGPLAYGPDAIAAPDPSLNTFPDAPPAPRESLFGPVAKRTALGLAMGGLPGAAVGLIGGLLGNRSGGLLGDMGPGFDAAVPSGDRFSTGAGLGGIMDAMGGARGAQGFSRSNPGMSYTSLGPANGGLRRSDKFGWTERVDPSGSVTGISYDNGGGGLLGSISRGLGSLIGGDKDRDKDGKSKGKGLGGYSGKGLY